MFWTDWGDYPKIERASMDGDPSTRVTLVEGNIGWPNGLTLDYENKRLYWVEAKFNEINSVDWNGHNRRMIFKDPNMLPLPFAVSYYNKELYWTDWKTK